MQPLERSRATCSDVQGSTRPILEWKIPVEEWSVTYYDHMCKVTNYVCVIHSVYTNAFLKERPEGCSPKCSYSPLQVVDE